MQFPALKAGFIPSVLLAMLACSPLTAAAENYNNQPQVQTFIDMMVDKHGFTQKELETVFNDQVNSVFSLKFGKNLKDLIFFVGNHQ